MNSFSIIIVSWNALHHLQTFLPSVCATEYPDFEIILANNNSSDNSVQWVKKNFPQVNVFEMDQNYGYCGGNNRAAKVATKDTLIFLNNDVEVTPNWLDGIDSILTKHPDVSVVQPKLRSYKDREYFEYAGAAGGFIDKYGYPFCRGRIFDTLEKDEGQYDVSGPIFWASGAAMVIRSPDFRDASGFDESFVFHMEEIDLCWRLQRKGKQIWYCAESTVYHLGGGSLGINSPRKVFYNFRNNLAMLTKNLPSGQMQRTVFSRIALDKLASAKFLTYGEWRNSMAVFRALFAYLGRIPALSRQRKLDPPHKLDNTSIHGILDKSLVWEYFVKKHRKYSDLL